MDKRVVLSVAGSGKTTYIINSLNLTERSLILTDTINNTQNLRDKVILKFGYFPNNITIMPYFTFLYSFCFRPFLSHKFKIKGINYEANPNRFAKQTDANYYIDKYNRIYSNRIAKLLEQENVLIDINNRITKYFSNLFIDEIQDFAGHDFNFIKNISKATIKMMFVGDFYQHTFATSHDGTVNQNLHNDYSNYKNLFIENNIFVDETTLNKSYRCSHTICNFITDNIGIKIYSGKDKETQIHIVEAQDGADEIFQNNNIIKLFYQEHYKYQCYSRNWGDCKGEDKYYDVCVVLNKTTLDLFAKGKLKELKSQTKNKLYVACSRAKNDLYFVSEELYKKYKN